MKLLTHPIQTVKDTFNILRLWRESNRELDIHEYKQVHGVPVNILGDLTRNHILVERLQEKWGTVDDQFEMIIMLTAEALKAVGKHFDTDIYLERNILDGAREREAYKHFLVERQEVDRAMLMMIFDRDKIDALSRDQSDQRRLKHLRLHQWHTVQNCRCGQFGSVIDDDYSENAVQQVEDYFDWLFQEETIIHVLGRSGKIVRILRHPYELPKNVYQRTSFPSGAFSLTSFLMARMEGNSEQPPADW